MPFKVKAIFDYNSGHEDDLPFSIGQIITVNDEEDADWYGGEYVDESGVKQEGIFPRNFVEKYEPTAPPRPTRTRTKQQLEQTSTASEPPAAPAPAPAATSPLLSPKLPAHEPEEEKEHAKITSPTRTFAAPAPVPAPAAAPASKPTEPVETFSPPPPAPGPVAAPAPAVIPPPASKPTPTQSKPSGPPPVSEKPSSFKDRIAAFNKAAAPPVAPFKPSGLGAGNSGFIKKPFVAPPPSRHSYVPPVQSAPVAKVYRRDEDPEIKEREAENLESAERAGLMPTSSTDNQNGEDEDQPKTLTLKERLALLQKQQADSAQRHADAAAKKEKPKRPAKKRVESYEAAAEESEASIAPPLDRRDSEDHGGKKSLDEPRPPRLPHPPRRRSSKGPEVRDGNEADMSGAGEMTEGQEDELTEREDSDDRSKKHVATLAKQEDEDIDEEEVAPEDEEEEEEEEVDPEVRRKEELRARMARIAGGMGGMGGMGAIFGGPVPTGAPAPPRKKKSAPERQGTDASEEPTSPTTHAPPVPMMMALPGMSRVKSNESQPRDVSELEEDEEDDERNLRTPQQEHAPPAVPPRESAAAPPVPGGRPAPPPVPTESRPPPPPPPAAVLSPSEGSESGDELSEHPDVEDLQQPSQPSSASRAPPPLPPVAAAPSPLASPTSPHSKRLSYLSGEGTPISPTIAAPVPTSGNKRDSRLPPPVPGSAPAPPPAQTRPPPPPPPGGLSRTSTADTQQSLAPTRLVSHDDDDQEEEEEITEYEGDYDTDIASSVPHKDALKSHQRESSFEDTKAARSPVTEVPPPFMPPPVPSAAAPRGPPPIPSHPPPESRRSVEVPRAAPPPPPPAKEAPKYADDDDYDPYNYTSPSGVIPVASPQPLTPVRRTAEESYVADPSSSHQPSLPDRRAPPPAPPTTRAPPRQSLDMHRPGRRSVDITRPSMESGYVANDIDLATHTGWWLKPNSVPPQLQGRKDIYFESEESKSSSTQGKTIVTRDIYVLFQDYSQTVITARYDPADQSDIQLEQRHEAPPRTLRQDQLEQAYERFGRAMGDAVSGKKDTVVGDGTPQALIFELLRPHRDALLPVGTRAYGALVYSNLANASTTQNDEIRQGDIISIRNAKFQGKHGPMHAKYSMDVGKPDHVGIVSEWDGTKKKVRAWEQGRESKKVKVESFKLDDLRSGEVKIWRVMPRSWVGWEGGN